MYHDLVKREILSESEFWETYKQGKGKAFCCVGQRSTSKFILIIELTDEMSNSSHFRLGMINANLTDHQPTAEVSVSLMIDEHLTLSLF